MLLAKILQGIQFEIQVGHRYEVEKNCDMALLEQSFFKTFEFGRWFAD